MCAILGYDGKGPNLPGVASRDVESRANIACCEHAVVVLPWREGGVGLPPNATLPLCVGSAREETTYGRVPDIITSDQVDEKMRRIGHERRAVISCLRM